MIKKGIVAIICCLLAADALLLVVPQPSVAALSAWLTHSSECSLGQLTQEMRQAMAVGNIGDSISLVKTEGGLDLWNSPKGPIWSVHGDKMIDVLLIEQARDIYEPAGHEVRKGDIVLDCGANIGVFTRTALKRGASRVVAIEPAPQTLVAFRRNFEGEIREGRVIVYPAGVWDQDSELELSVDSTNLGNSSMIDVRRVSGARVRVPVTTIDKIVSELGLPRVDFIKMDIEGAEKNALKGAAETIRRYRPRMSISLEHLEDDITAIPSLVHTLDPDYVGKTCDCVVSGGRIKALVMAFDPVGTAR